MSVNGLPSHWGLAPLCDVADVELGKMLDKKRLAGSQLPYLRNINVRWGRVDTSDLLTMPFRDQELDRYGIRTGDVLVCEGGEPGRAAVWTGGETEIKYQKALHRIRLKGGLESRWLVYQLYFDATRGGLARHFTGTTIKHLTRTVIRQYKLRVPPIAEQLRAVEAIESYFSRLDDAVSTLERVQANLKRYRASVLKAAVEGRLVPTEAELAREEDRDCEPASVLLERILTERRRRWEEAELAKLKAKGKPPKNDVWKSKYKEPVAPNKDGLPELPEGWCWATLPMLGELDRGRSRHRPRNDPRLLGGLYPFIQTGDVKQAEGVITGYSATYSEFGLAQSKLWASGTLCITIAANIAQTAILGFDACFPDSIVGFFAPERPELTRFIEFFMRTAREDLDRYAPATAQKNINLKILSEVAIPLPPDSEQLNISNAIEKHMSVARHVERAVHESSFRVDRLRQSILKWAFEGKLVDQDPNDEPASVLLERIKAEREAAPKQTKRKSRKTTRTKA